MQTIDLYSDYEGYQKIVLTEETSLNEIIFEVQLLGFHFDEVLSFIPLGEYNQDSVSYNYLRSTGWHDGKWECTRIQEFYNQLLLLDNLIPSNYMNVYNAMKQICNSALQNGNKLFIDLQ